MNLAASLSHNEDGQAECRDGIPGQDGDWKFEIGSREPCGCHVKLGRLAWTIRVGVGELQVAAMAFPVAAVAQSNQTPLFRYDQKSSSHPSGTMTLKKVQLAHSCIYTISVCLPTHPPTHQHRPQHSDVSVGMN